MNAEQKAMDLLTAVLKTSKEIGGELSLYAVRNTLREAERTLRRPRG